MDAPNAVQSAAKAAATRAADGPHGPLRRENRARRFMRKLSVVPNWHDYVTTVSPCDAPFRRYTLPKFIYRGRYAGAFERYCTANMTKEPSSRSDRRSPLKYRADWSRLRLKDRFFDAREIETRIYVAT